MAMSTTDGGSRSVAHSRRLDPARFHARGVDPASGTSSGRGHPLRTSSTSWTTLVQTPSGYQGRVRLVSSSTPTDWACCDLPRRTPARDHSSGRGAKPRTNQLGTGRFLFGRWCKGAPQYEELRTQATPRADPAIVAFCADGAADSTATASRGDGWWNIAETGTPSRLGQQGGKLPAGQACHMAEVFRRGPTDLVRRSCRVDRGDAGHPSKRACPRRGFAPQRRGSLSTGGGHRGRLTKNITNRTGTDAISPIERRLGLATP